MRLFTIGFTHKSARVFFTKMTDAVVRRVVDVRLNNTSNLAGFTRRDNLPYLLEAIGDIGYLHLTQLSPSPELFTFIKAHKRGDGYKREAWIAYEKDFLELLQNRAIEQQMKGVLQDGDCFLCSEPLPDQCHRRLVAEYLQRNWEGVEIRHLV